MSNDPCVKSFCYEVRIPRGGELVVCKGRSADSWKTARARMRTCMVHKGAQRPVEIFLFPPRSEQVSLLEANDHNGALASLHVKLERTSILSRTVPGI